MRFIVDSRSVPLQLEFPFPLILVPVGLDQLCVKHDLFPKAVFVGGVDDVLLDFRPADIEL
jgi:hypothetical protein